MDDINWKSMYMTLFHGITDAVALLPMTLENAPACERLSRALQEAEEQYIENDARPV